MKASLGLVALSSVLGVVDAQLVWWHRDDEQTYHPPQQTEQPLKELLQNAFDPMPTPPPKASILQARAEPNNTCGFMRGDPDSALYCARTEFCAYHASLSHYYLGCCNDDGLSCGLWTTCLDSTESSRFTLDGTTMLCDDPEFPYCYTHIYRDPVWTGFTVLGCGVRRGRGDIYYTPLRVTDSSRSVIYTTSTTSRSSSSRSTSDPIFSSSSTDPIPPPTPPPEPEENNTGAIIGGVVGGVAALGLIGLVAVIFMRRKKHDDNQPSPPAVPVVLQQPNQPSPPAPAPTNPHMSQVYSIPSTSPAQSSFDPRQSMAAGQTGISPMGSPSPISPTPPSAAFGTLQTTPSPQSSEQQQQQQWMQTGNVLPHTNPAYASAGFNMYSDPHAPQLLQPQLAGYGQPVPQQQSVNYGIAAVSGQQEPKQYTAWQSGPVELPTQNYRYDTSGVNELHGSETFGEGAAGRGNVARHA
ncbi:uncharacterized protein CTHT_0065890 [Thermochaetoides thermophila DSM 1495]|uniref:Uncharacterized protein n=1 Tax=Chaetomium thermophilum (strain DSM 1495 / CBS 144.50 / IMI 039719) TaxID=759272 RepID=G0SGD1_CHATD|nr:hypothetical protein CTHT_0065890 [Thermochaetoides thermophila DSM 1495]EGS17270.1 hypothetical protein CTHT_0065890 [Thermochaetoides thermophila DSM 1495]